VTLPAAVPAPHPLEQHNTVILDAAGGAEVVFGPVPDGTRWRVTMLGLKADPGSSAGTPGASLYRGSPAAVNLIDFTPKGGDDLADFADFWISPGDVLTVVWSGGTAGARITARLYGTQVPI
jgi:hypothetical protein